MANLKLIKRIFVKTKIKLKLNKIVNIFKNIKIN